ncbi:MAG TPA: arginase family protein [Mycobacterium sp.]
MPIAVVHFDAHLDTWDTPTSGSRLHMGTPFRRAFEEGLLEPKGVSTSASADRSMARRTSPMIVPWGFRSFRHLRWRLWEPRRDRPGDGTRGQPPGGCLG